MDAASIAAITALCHFRRPDVSTQGQEVTVVSQQHHSRWCLSFPGPAGRKLMMLLFSWEFCFMLAVFFFFFLISVFSTVQRRETPFLWVSTTCPSASASPSSNKGKTLLLTRFLLLCIKMLMSCLQVQQVLVNSVYSVVFIESHFRPPPAQNSWRGSPHQPATTSWGVRGSSVHWGMKTVPWLVVLHGPGYFRNCWSSFPTCKNITWSDSTLISAVTFAW